MASGMVAPPPLANQYPDAKSIFTAKMKSVRAGKWAT